MTKIKKFLLFLAAALPFQAQAALVWDYQSTSTTQAKYAAGWRDCTRLGSGSIPLVLTAGPSGTFGGTYLDSAAGQLQMSCAGADNGPVNTNAVTILWRLVPTFTGNPSGNAGIFNFGGDIKEACGLSFQIDTASKLVVNGGNVVNNGYAYFNDATFGTGFSFTQDIPTDLWFVWDGSSASGHVKIYQAQNGGTAALVSTLTAPTDAVNWLRSCLGTIGTYDRSDGSWNNNKFGINEIAIWNTAENPISYGARTDFVYTGAAYEGYNHTSLAASSVKNGDVYGPGPGSLTGTYNPTLALAATTKHGVPASDGTGSYVGADWCTDPGVNFVRSTATYKTAGVDTAGNYVIPGTAQVKQGFAYGVGGTGSTGGLVCTALATNSVVNGIAYTNFTGDFTGSFLPSCTSVPPEPEDVRAGTIYTVDTIGYLGTLHVPPVGKVQLGYAFDDDVTTGTLACTTLDPATVGLGVGYTNYTGAHTGTLAYITNTFDSARTTSLSPLRITQGDDAVSVTLYAKSASGAVADLTGATLTTTIKGSSANVTLTNSVHTLVDAAAGKYSFTLTSTNTGALSPGPGHEIVTKAVIGGSTVYFHGVGLLQVLKNTPEH